MNVDKCVVQSNCFRNVGGPSILLDGIEMHVVAAQVGFQVLGTKYTLCGGVGAEFDNRIAAGWAEFYSILPLLRKKHTSCKKRLRLFNAVVGRSILWACESWTLTAKQKQTLKSAQRNMLRRFLAPARKPEEGWVEWVQRATHAVEHFARGANVKSWVEDFLVSKWKWAGHVARMRSDSLPLKATVSKDADWRSYQTPNTPGFSSRIRRARRGRWQRWEDEVYGFYSNWTQVAKDREQWQCMERRFVYSRLK